MNRRKNKETAHILKRGVVVSPRHAFIRPWIRAYFAAGNTIPLIIVPGPPGDWQPGDMEYCKAAAESCGGLVFDCSSEWELSRKFASRAVLQTRVGWYSKKSILHAVASRLSPSVWAWIDDDAEVTGCLDECFDMADKAPGFIYAQFYYPNDKDVCHPARMYRSNIDTGDKVCWNSMVFFHGDANKQIVKELCRDFPVEDDEIIFGHLYQTNKVWYDGFCDFSPFGWQMNCKRLSQIPVDWHGKLLHYTSHANRGEVKTMWANKASHLPQAPFETIAKASPVSIGENDDSAVDAVFVVGKGSSYGDEELRYALRSLEYNCKFVRNVYICGECPTWVDVSKVRHLQWPDRFKHAKDANIIDKLRHACEMKGIAKNILFCSDDQFQTKGCSWDDFSPRYLRRYSSDDPWYIAQGRIWHNRLRKTLEREVQRRKDVGLDVSSVFYYQPHIWMQIDRDTFLAYAKWCDYAHRDDTIIASGYFNYAGVEGKANFDHVFMGSFDSAEVPAVRHVAYHDVSYRKAIEIMRKLFPRPSRFEVPAKTVWAPLPSLSPLSSFAGNGAKSDRSPATSKEMAELLDVMSRVRKEPTWHKLLGEVSMAEELRLFGVEGWRIVWYDLISRWNAATGRGAIVMPVQAGRSPEAEAIIAAYTVRPAQMRTIRYNESDHQVRKINTVKHRQSLTTPEASKEASLARARELLRERL
jgi:hypothetical protein